MIETLIPEQFSVSESENTITLGSAAWDSRFRDRASYDRESLLTQAINAWRSNPLARRVVAITTEFVLGEGFTFACRNARAQRHLEAFWNHRLNQVEAQLPEWADEAWRSGDLFLLFSRDRGGGVYVRALPAEQVKAIETAPNDMRQELAYDRGAALPALPAWDPAQEQEAFVLHFPLERAAGALFGESDLVPILHWLGLYRTWLEDRARLNQQRQFFAYLLKRKFGNSAERSAYINNFKQRLPQRAGGVLAVDSDEELSVIEPHLAAHEAGEDGLAIKRMIAAGAGLPLHYLAEPEESTRTTAESADTPTFKHFKRRQAYLRNVVATVLATVLELGRSRDARLPALENAGLRVYTPDISERDNAALAIAAQRMVNAGAPLYNARLIDSAEFLRLVYRFLAETPPAPAAVPGEPAAFSPVKPRLAKIPTEGQEG